LNELDLAALRGDLPEHGLVAGDIGTVVGVYDEGRAYEVEFLTMDGRTLAVETLASDAVETVSGRNVLHARKLASV
jgi:hypothetical protein